MFDPLESPTTDDNSLALDLLHFFDEFSEFHDYCAFLCDAVSGIVSREEVLELATIQGLSGFAGHLKYRAGELHEKLEYLHEKSRDLAK